MYLLLLTPVDSSRNRYRLARGWPSFSSLTEARTFVETTRFSLNAPDISIHEWLGEVRGGRPVFAGDPLAADALFLPLPHRGTGCRDEHRPLLELAEQVIGTGLPLDALTGVDSGDPDAWEIDDSDRGEVLSVTIRCAVRHENVYYEEQSPTGPRNVISEEVWRYWSADDSCQDDGSPWPVGVTVDDVTEAVNEYVNSQDNPPDDDAEEGDEGDACYVGLLDGEIIGCYDDPDEAEEAINDRLGESRCGYPWAWNWAYYLDYPSDSKVVAAIKSAGYTVAAQASTGYLFAGIDGGGYDFDSAHKAPLGAALSHLWYQLIDGAIPVGPAL